MPRLGDRQSLERRREVFWSRVAKGGPDECWEWQGGRTVEGYGVFWWKDRRVPAHVFAHFLETGEWPTGKYVCHDCDNPPCCNPRHLYGGNALTNARDRKERGRSNPPRGEARAFAKLTTEKVLEIRALHKNGALYTQIAARYGIHPVTVRRIVLREKWRHV